MSTLKPTFKCPQCNKRRTIREVRKLVDDDRLVKHFWFHDYSTQVKNSPDYSIYMLHGQSNITNTPYTQTEYICAGEKCGFRIPVDNEYELLEWLISKGMYVEHGNYTGQSSIKEYRTLIRPKLIKDGKLSEQYIKDLYPQGIPAP